MTPTYPRWPSSIAIAVAAWSLAGCNLVGGLFGSPDPGEPQDPEALEQSFGPLFAPRPPPGQPTRIHRATLSPDRRTLTIEFVGGFGYLASDPCSTDYEPWLAPHGDELDVMVVRVHHPEQAVLPPNQACTLEGYGWTFHLALAGPFTGTTINDLGGGGTLLVGPPAATAHLRVLPAGWTLQAQFQLEPGPPPTWAQIYAASPVAPVPDEGPGRLVLYQAFGIVGEWTDTRAVKSEDRGGTATDVTFNGATAKVWVDPGLGELLLGWDAGGRSYGLVGNTADMTVDDLVRYAESLVLPD